MGNDRVFKVLIENEKLKIEHLCSDRFDFLPLHSLCRSSEERVDMAETLLKKTIELKLVLTFQINYQYRHHVKNLTINATFIRSLLPQVLERIEEMKKREFLLSLEANNNQNQTDKGN